MNLQELKALIENKRGGCVSFGTAENAPAEEWVKKAEERLRKPLPKSYKWFLNNYGGGEIYGEEIYSIYEKDFETAFGGDIICQYLLHQRSGSLQVDEVPLSENDFGELYYLKTSEPDRDGEYPVFVRRGRTRERYAANFAEFLKKRIEAP